MPIFEMCYKLCLLLKKYCRSRATMVIGDDDENIKNKVAIFFGFLDVMPNELSVYARWVLLRFIILFGPYATDLTLQVLATEIGVQHKKLRAVLIELEESGLLVISYPEGGKRARVRHIQLNMSCLNLVDGSQPDFKTELNRLEKALPLFTFIKFMLITKSCIKVSNVKNEIENSQLVSFKVFMVLLTLLQFSDGFGIVFQCGMAELTKATGLPKLSLFRCITELKKAGLIRSRVDGTINNNFISMSKPFYVLNLSHFFWQEVAIYGDFYCIEYLGRHQFEVQKVAGLFDLIRNQKKSAVVPIQKEGGEELIQEDANDTVSANLMRQDGNYLLEDPLCYLKALSNITGQLASFEKIQQGYVQNFLWHFNSLSSLHQRKRKLTSFSADFKKNKKEKSNAQGAEGNENLNSIKSNFGLLQCVLEQLCCHIYTKNTLLYTALKDGNTIEIKDIDFLKVYKKYDFYPSELDAAYKLSVRNDAEIPDSVSRERKIEIQKKIEEAVINDFLISIMNLIAYNQIHFFQSLFDKYTPVEDEQNSETVKPRVFLQAVKELPQFRILPRYDEQTNSTCIFVPDPDLKENRYFLATLQRNIYHVNSQTNSSMSFPSVQFTQIQPSLENMKRYGLLHSECAVLEGC